MLVTKLQELQEGYPLINSMDIKALKPYFPKVEREYIIPVIGKQQYDAVLIKYNASNHVIEDMDENSQKLLKQIHLAYAHLVLMEAATSLAVMVSTNGLQRIEGENNKTAYQYQERNWKRDRKDHGFAALDALIEFVELYIDIYDLYRDSPERIARRRQLIADASTFNNYVNIKNSGWTFLQLKSHLKFSEENSLLPLLGDDLLASIKEELEKTVPDFDAGELKLLDYCRGALAHLAWADAIPDLGVTIDDRGVTIYNNTETKTDDPQKAAAEKKESKLIDSHKEKAAVYIKNIQTHLTPPITPTTVNATILTLDNTSGYAAI